MHSHAAGAESVAKPAPPARFPQRSQLVGQQHLKRQALDELRHAGFAVLGQQRPLLQLFLDIHEIDDRGPRSAAGTAA